MKRSARPRKTTLNLSPSLTQRLNTYALSAGAAGVALLAAPQSSEAEIVYTPAHQIINRNASYSLDLNQDGIIDYIFAVHVSNRPFGSVQTLMVRQPTGNHVQCVSSTCISTFIYAAALERGAELRTADKLGWCAPGPAPMALEVYSIRARSGFYSQDWANVSDRYLGFWFQINGENHYGWARLSVKFHPGLPKIRTWEALLTGYAYETVADKKIRAGQTSDNDDDASTAPLLAPSIEMRGASPNNVNASARTASLGELALGASGMVLWRRDETSEHP